MKIKTESMHLIKLFLIRRKASWDSCKNLPNSLFDAQLLALHLARVMCVCIVEPVMCDYLFGMKCLSLGMNM